MNAIDSLMTVARAYADAAAVELTTVSWRVFGDSKKLGAIGAGKDIQVRRFERAMVWFSEHWPPEAAWPDNVSRPGITVALPETTREGKQPEAAE